MVSTTLASLLTVATVSIASWVVHVLFFHPLRFFPGPKTWAITQLPWHLRNMAGKLAFKLKELHDEYCDVVRIEPNELSFVATSVDTWRTIYHHKPSEMPKNLRGTGLHPPYNGVAGIEASDSKNHPRIRKAMSPAFSERALRDQEGYINIYIHKLTAILRASGAAAPQDFAKLFNWMTFDIVGDLALGESFDGLDKQKYHPWVATIFDGIKAIAFLQFVLYYNLGELLHMVTPGHLAEQRDKFYALAFDKTDERLSKTEDRRDFVSYMNAERDGQAVMSRKEIHTSFSTLLVAGSESSATHLSGTIYLLLRHPESYQKLCSEIRNAFASKDDVTVRGTQQLEYLGRVMQESFRCYPPAPATIPRVVPGDGGIIDGYWVPGGTVVGINQWSTYRSPKNFTAPHTFVPERWLPDGKRPANFDSDNRLVLQPFSYDPRDCLGKTLANAEIRLTLCRLLVEFDLRLSEEIGDWTDQLQFLTWEKKPLLVFVRPRSAHD